MKTKCERFGHDYAIKDLGDWMVKICLRCKRQVFFWPADDMDEDDDE